MTSELPSIIITTFISAVIFIVGFILGERQAKVLGHNFSEKILIALQLAVRGDIENTTYSRRTGDYEFNYPDSTTASG